MDKVLVPNFSVLLQELSEMEEQQYLDTQSKILSDLVL